MKRFLPLIVGALTAICVVIIGLLLLRPSGRQAGPLRRTSQVSVTSRPEGATLLLDGRFAGLTPVRVQGVENGVHVVKLERAGYQPVTRQVVTGPESDRIEIPLDPIATGAIEVDSVPEGSEIYVDGELRGRSPMRIEGLPAGLHTVVLRKINHEDSEVTVNVKSDHVRRIEKKLKDRVESVLLGLIAAQPKRIAHHTDLAHYYFINGKLGPAIEQYRVGIELGTRPGANAGEFRRHLKEIRKHSRLPGRDAEKFRGQMLRLYAKFNLRQKL